MNQTYSLYLTSDNLDEGLDLDDLSGMFMQIMAHADYPEYTDRLSFFEGTDHGYIIKKIIKRGKF